MTVKSVSRKRGPSPAKTDATRTAILDAALAEFAANGLDRTRMSDVAARAGVAKGTTYLYFADKQALFEGVVTHFMVAPLQAFTAARRLPGETAPTFFRRALLPLVARMDSTPIPIIVRLVVEEGRHHPALAEAYHRLVITPGLAAIRSLGESLPPQMARFPQLVLAPVLLGMLWNGLFGTSHALDLVAMLEDHVSLMEGQPHPTG